MENNPVQMLMMGVLLLGFLLFLFWPRFGLRARLELRRIRLKRIQLEDALKHIYDCDYRLVACSLESIAGALSISVDDAVNIITRLESHGLVQRREREFHLTQEGRSYALRIIRIHRLWERYLADDTDIRESDWHKEAERREHFFSSDEVEYLAKYLGNPLYNPHGDPIPTPSGYVPEKEGTALTSLEVGQVATVVHVEDEPASIYEQLVAQDIHPGIMLQVIEKSNKRLLLEAYGKEIALAPVTAANVYVVEIIVAKKPEIEFDTLDMLRPGEEAHVLGFSPTCRGLQRRRMMDLGIVPGVKVTAEFRSVGKDPIAYRIRESLLALRTDQTREIFTEKRKGKDN